MEGCGLIFWGVCIPLRTVIAAHAGPKTYLLRSAAADIGVRWLLGMENGHEGMFGGPTWWAEERPCMERSGPSGFS